MEIHMKYLNGLKPGAKQALNDGLNRVKESP